VFLRLVSLCSISEETLKASGTLEQQDASASYHLVGSNGTRDMTGSTSTLQVLLCFCPAPEPPLKARRQLLRSRRVSRRIENRLKGWCFLHTWQQFKL